VSEAAMFKYTTALQGLLSSKKNKLFIGDDTTVFWASSPDKTYENIAWALFEAADEDGESANDVGVAADAESELKISSILQQGTEGIVAASYAFGTDVDFCVLGLAPNAGRISVRYFYKSSFKDFYEKIFRYYQETHVCGRSPHIKLKWLISGTVSSKSSDKNKKVNPLLGGAVMRAVLSGGEYPRLLLTQVIVRVKAEAIVTQSRAAAIKAYLMRNKKEDWLPVLNESSTNRAYILGRTFAILEKKQQDAASGKLNSTIKDKYFRTACSNPGLAFPALLKLTQHHKPRNQDGNESRYLDFKLRECLALLGENFPKTFDMESQGRFILGYYQQTAKLYEKKEANTNTKEDDLDGSN
jgi:CRISPR-associated protein Csd1